MTNEEADIFTKKLLAKYRIGKMTKAIDVLANSSRLNKKVGWYVQYPCWIQTYSKITNRLSHGPMSLNPKAICGKNIPGRKTSTLAFLKSLFMTCGRMGWHSDGEKDLKKEWFNCIKWVSGAVFGNVTFKHKETAEKSGSHIGAWSCTENGRNLFQNALASSPVLNHKDHFNRGSIWTFRTIVNFWIFYLVSSLIYYFLFLK